MTNAEQCETAPQQAGPCEVARGEVNASDILTIRRGPGANCSSIGSALDLLFLSAVAAGVVLAGVAAAFGGSDPPRREPEKADHDGEGPDAGAG